MAAVPQPQLLARFYVENGVGRRVCAALNLFTGNHRCEAEFQHDVHPQMQLPQQGDEWWIDDATAKGFVIITGDEAIFRVESERETVITAAARIITFARADYSAWQMIAGLSSHWVRIEEQLLSAGPWILKVYAGSTSPVLLLP
jgi:hypothetical protein